jgi:hypothetical protein
MRLSIENIYHAYFYSMDIVELNKFKPILDILINISKNILFIIFRLNNIYFVYLHMININK